MDTTAAATGAVGSQGFIGSPTFGEVITAPMAADHYLTSFTFYASNFTTDYKNIAQVYAWDGTSATGSALFTSSAFTVSGSAKTPYFIDTSAGGGVSMTPGSQYVMLFTVVGAGNSPGSGWSQYAIATTNPDPNGYFVNNGTSSMTSGWSTTGMTGLGMMRGRRRLKLETK